MLRGIDSRAAYMSTNDPITLRPEGRLLIAVLSRPPDNFIDQALASSLKELCATLREDSPFDALIITGDGQEAGGNEAGGVAFSRGTDQHLLSESAEATSGNAAQALFESYRCASAIASLPFPVIAAVNGDAFNQGLELALSADIRVAAETAQFRMGQALQGIIPWDGGTQRLPRIVGPAHATDLLLTGRTIGAGEALEMGLVNRVAPPADVLSTAQEIAEQILAGGPIAARYAKEVILVGSEMTLDQGILLETDLTMILQTTKDREEGIRSFLERRDPEFTGE